jgi:hypothetical protein
MKKLVTEYPLSKLEYGEVVELTASNGREKHDFVVLVPKKITS